MNLNRISHSPSTITLREYVGQHERDERMARTRRLVERLDTQTSQAADLLTTHLHHLTQGHVTAGTPSVEHYDRPAHSLSLAARVTLPIPGDDIALFIDVEVSEDERGNPDSHMSHIAGVITCTGGRAHVRNIFSVADVRYLYADAAECGCA